MGERGKITFQTPIHPGEHSWGGGDAGEHSLGGGIISNDMWKVCLLLSFPGGICLLNIFVKIYSDIVDVTIKLADF